MSRWIPSVARHAVSARRAATIAAGCCLALLSCGETAEPTRTPSAERSTVTLSPATVPSGTTATVTLQVRDEGGNALDADGLAVTFNLGNGTSAGTFSAVSDNGNGTYSSLFTGTTAGTAREITATLGGSPVTSARPSVTVVPGAPSATQSTVSTSASTVASGSTATLGLQLRDAAGNALATGGHTVEFTLQGGTSAGSIGAVTDHGNGSYSATFTGTTAGSARTIGATVNGLAVSAALPTVTVTSGPASTAHSTVEVSTNSVPLGGIATLTLRTRDAATNLLTSGGLTVAFTTSGGTSAGSIGATADHGDGRYTATFTGTVAGTAVTVGATIGGTPVGSGLPTLIVTSTAIPISPAMSAVSVTSSTIPSGTSTTITLQAKDADGNNITFGGATVAFTLGAGTSTGTIGAVTDNGNGTYTAPFTGVLAGSATAIQATINAAQVTSTAPTITVTPGAASPDNSTLAADDATVAAGTTTTLRLQAIDAAGNTIVSGGATVAFSLAPASGTSAGTIGAVTDHGDGTYTATFSGTTAGTAREVEATLNGSSVTTPEPAIMVIPGLVSPANSVVSVSGDKVPISGSTTLTLTARDAFDNALTTGGETVAFALGGGTSAGTIGGTNDHGDGTYSAEFSGTTEGTAANVGATIGGAPVTTTAPSLLVYAPGITFASDNVQIIATQGLAAPPRLTAVFANGATTAAGLQAVVTYTTPSIPTCQSTNWLGTPTFDVTTANPVSVITLNATAAGLGIDTCTATVTISSTTPGIASRSFTVSLSVARNAIATTAVQLVFMGNAGNASQQDLTPDARILISNGGRGVATGLHATVLDAVGDPDPWLTTANLRWEPVVADTNARPAPATLVVSASVAPFSATATIRVTGDGIPPIDIPVSVFFNIQPELVTNPRGMVFNVFEEGTSAVDSVIAFNQNHGVVEDSLRNYRRNPAAPLPSWLSAAITPMPNDAGQDTAAKVVLTANPTGLRADSIYTDTLRLEADVCTTFFGSETVCVVEDPPTTKAFALPVKVVVERGLVLSASEVTLFAPAGTATVSSDIEIANGGSTPITGLITSGISSWLTGAIVGGDDAPTTLRLIADPTGLPRGTVLTTGLNVLSTPTSNGIPARSVIVTLRVY